MVSLYEKMFFKSYLNEGEEIYFVIHRHWIFVIRMMIILTFLGVVGPFVWWYVMPDIFWIALLLVSITYLIMFYKLADWYFDAWIVTNSGMIAVTWDGFFSRKSYRIDYSVVEGVVFEQYGVLPRIFDYGNITIIKIGDSFTMEMNGVSNPKKVEKQVMEYKDIAGSHNSLGDEEALKDILSKMIKRHIDEHGVEIHR
jgi:hypothetical protein